MKPFRDVKQQCLTVLICLLNPLHKLRVFDLKLMKILKKSAEISAGFFRFQVFKARQPMTNLVLSGAFRCFQVLSCQLLQVRDDVLQIVARFCFGFELSLGLNDLGQRSVRRFDPKGSKRAFLMATL